MPTDRPPSPASTLARRGVANLAIQLVTLLSKSLLLFILARFLEVREVGVFSLLVVTLALGVHLVGLDFYAFSTREILAAGPTQIPLLLRDQMVFHLMTYPLALFGGALPFAVGTLPWGLLGIFLPLLLAEHFAQEIQRVLVTLGRPVHGALVLLVRAGLWIWIAAVVLLLDRTVGPAEIATIWLAGSVASIALGLAFLRDLSWSRVRAVPVDWAWIRNGLRIAMPFLVASFSYRGILTVDRYSLERFHGPEAVGVYSLFASFRNAVLSFVEMGILFVYRPPVIAAWQARRMESLDSLLGRMRRALLVLPLALSVLAAVAVFPLLEFVGRPEYRENLHLLWPLLAGAVVASIGEAPHTVLYAANRDRVIVATSLLALLVAILLCLALVPTYGPLGAALATLASFAALSASKSWLASRSA